MLPTTCELQGHYRLFLTISPVLRRPQPHNMVEDPRQLVLAVHQVEAQKRLWFLSGLDRYGYPIMYPLMSPHVRHLQIENDLNKALTAGHQLNCTIPEFVGCTQLLDKFGLYFEASLLLSTPVLSLSESISRQLAQSNYVLPSAPGGWLVAPDPLTVYSRSCFRFSTLASAKRNISSSRTRVSPMQTSSRK